MLLHLKFDLELIELLDGLGVNVCIEVGRVTAVGLLTETCVWASRHSLSRVALHECRIRLLFNPEVLRRLKVISKDRDDLLDLIVTVQIHEEVYGQSLL